MLAQDVVSTRKLHSVLLFFISATAVTGHGQETGVERMGKERWESKSKKEP